MMILMLPFFRWQGNQPKKSERCLHVVCIVLLKHKIVELLDCDKFSKTVNKKVWDTFSPTMSADESFFKQYVTNTYRHITVRLNDERIDKRRQQYQTKTKKAKFWFHLSRNHCCYCVSDLIFFLFILSSVAFTEPTKRIQNTELTIVHRQRAKDTYKMLTTVACYREQCKIHSLSSLSSSSS